jgi:hypothetical protein
MFIPPSILFRERLFWLVTEPAQAQINSRDRQRSLKTSGRAHTPHNGVPVAPATIFLRPKPVDRFSPGIRIHVAVR